MCIFIIKTDYDEVLGLKPAGVHSVLKFHNEGWVKNSFFI
jgi:hypothetical protein